MTCRAVTAFCLRCDAPKCRARTIVALDVGAILEWAKESNWKVSHRDDPDRRDLCGKCREGAK